MQLSTAGVHTGGKIEWPCPINYLSEDIWAPVATSIRFQDTLEDPHWDHYKRKLVP